MHFSRQHYTTVAVSLKTTRLDSVYYRGARVKRKEIVRERERMSDRERERKREHS
jgi:hypothetical protein